MGMWRSGSYTAPNLLSSYGNRRSSGGIPRKKYGLQHSDTGVDLKKLRLFGCQIEKTGCVVSLSALNGRGILFSWDALGGPIKALFERLRDVAMDTDKVARVFEEGVENEDTPMNARFIEALTFSIASSRSEWTSRGKCIGPKSACQGYWKNYWSRIETCSSQLFNPKVRKMFDLEAFCLRR